jgi:hypothetical protein
VRGPKGHAELFGGCHEPPFGEAKTCKIGIINQKIIITHAVVESITFTNTNFICLTNIKENV